MSLRRPAARLLTRLRSNGQATAEPAPRLVAGVKIASGCRAVTVALVSAEGRGLRAALRIVAEDSVEVGEDFRASYQQLVPSPAEASGQAAPLGVELADLSAELIQRLLRALAHPADKTLAVAVHDPGLWHISRGSQPACFGLCNATRLAERTGLDVIDAFRAGDLAGGGLGGPLLALPMWMLLADPHRPRLLLDLGRTVRLTYLPPRLARQGAEQVLSFDIGPGTVLPDALTEQFTGGEYHFDPGGTLAVQGRRIGDLIDHWLADPYFQTQPPRWYPLGVRPDAELHKTVQMAVEAGWTVRDLLCTATHFIAESIARAVRTRAPQLPPISEILLFGGGVRNGFLLSEIRRRLPEFPLRMATELCAGGETLEAAATAALGLLFLDQVPANHPAITGTKTARVLGRLTAGAR